MKKPDNLPGMASAKFDEMIALWSRVLAPSDAAMVADYCRAFVRQSEAEQKIEEFGTVVIGANGVPTQSVWLAVSDREGKTMRSIAALISKRRTAPKQ